MVAAHRLPREIRRRYIGSQVHALSRWPPTGCHVSSESLLRWKRRPEVDGMYAW